MKTTANPEGLTVALKNLKNLYKSNSVLTVPHSFKPSELLGLRYNPESLRKNSFDIFEINPKSIKNVTELTKSQIEHSNWLNAYLNEIPMLKNILGVSESATVMWSEVLEKPFISTKNGAAIILDRELGIWKEYSKETFDEINKAGKVLHKLKSLATTKTDGDITVKRIVSNDGDIKYIIYNGNKKMIRENFLETVEELGKEPQVRDFSQSFSSKAAYNSKSIQLDDFIYKTPNMQNVTMTTGYQHNSTELLNDIDGFVSIFDEGIFKKCSKEITINVNGAEERIHIVYEGIDCDIDDKGRVLKKIIVPDKVKEFYAKQYSKSHESLHNTTRLKENTRL